MSCQEYRDNYIKEINIYGIEESYDLKFKDGFTIEDVFKKFNKSYNDHYEDYEFSFNVKIENNKFIELSRVCKGKDNWYCGYEGEKYYNSYPWHFIGKKNLPSSETEVKEALWKTYGKYLDMSKKEFFKIVHYISEEYDTYYEED